MLIHGRCHCGNVSFELDWKPEPTEIVARACGCGFCIRHGGVWTSNPAATLKVTVREPSLVSRYSFATQTALFHVCSRCGVVPLVTCEIEGRVYAVVNVNAFDDVDPSLLSRKAMDFEGENIESRLGRRKRNWIADVEFVTRDA
ncbi:MAG: GFA family protein [Gemmatimonadota bacterium]